MPSLLVIKHRRLQLVSDLLLVLLALPQASLGP
jgi:hypothetical protein